MNKVYPDTFYMKVYEDFKRKDGSNSHYSGLMFNPSIWYIGKHINNKKDLKIEVEKRLSDVINLDDYSVTETKFGWKYERFVKWLDDDFVDGENVKEGDHTDHEIFTVDISYYEEVWDKFEKLPDT